RFLAIRAVVIDKAYLLALQLVKAAELPRDVLDGDVRSGPVAADGNEVPRKDCAVAAFRASITQCQERYLVTRNLFGEREGNAGRERGKIAGAGRSLALEALVALHTLGRVVAGLALLECNLDAVDAAVTFVQQRPVVNGAVGEWNSIWGI